MPEAPAQFKAILAGPSRPGAERRAGSRRGGGFGLPNRPAFVCFAPVPALGSARITGLRPGLRTWASLFLAAVWSGCLPDLAPGQSSGNDQVKTGAPPAWVEMLVPAARNAKDQHDLPGGQSLALYDQQTSLAHTQRFTRVVRDIVNETGVQNGANLSFSFDPSFETFTLHHLYLERGGQRLDRLAPASFRVIQQEQDLDRHLYNGALTALVFLEDVQVGDRIDYAFTITGENPVLQGRYAASFITRLTVPLDRLRVRLLVPEGRRLKFMARGHATEPVTRRVGTGEEFVWDFRGVPAVVLEDQVPSWVPMLPSVWISEFPDWATVAGWAAGLYISTNLQAPAFLDRVAALRQSGPAPETQIAAALRYVQTDIRYLGMEFGPNSCRPTDPVTVMARRFGDCKDQSFLLCALLQALGHDAAPVLVSTELSRAVGELPPTPYAFDHAIVRVRTGLQTFWLDPTRSFQRGPLAERFVPNYGYGLVVRPQETALTPIPASPAGAPAMTTLEEFTVGGQQAPATLAVTTTARGLDAEWLRSALASVGREELSKTWLNSYAERYPGIQATNGLVINDATNRDLITIEHRYVIPKFWQPGRRAGYLAAPFMPVGIQSWITPPSTRVRAFPLYVSFPRERVVKTVVQLPEPWSLTGTNFVISSPASKLIGTRSYAGNTVTLEHTYIALTNEPGHGDAAGPLQLGLAGRRRALHGYTGGRARALPLVAGTAATGLGGASAALHPGPPAAAAGTGRLADLCRPRVGAHLPAGSHQSVSRSRLPGTPELAGAYHARHGRLPTRSGRVARLRELLSTDPRDHVGQPGSALSAAAAAVSQALLRLPSGGSGLDRD
jgi:hypothetical protein